MIPLFRLLDARSSASCAVEPIRQAVNIPFGELPDRMHELPSKSVTIRVADCISEDVVGWLRAHGRQAEWADDYQIGPQNILGRLWRPNEFLENIVPQLKPGRVLDVACGAGRDAIYLASLGWEVRAFDHLPSAIEKAQQTAERYDLQTLLQFECKRISEWTSQETYDLITCFFYFDAHELKRLALNLNSGGSILLETFTQEHRERFGKPQDLSLVLANTALAPLLETFEIVRQDQDWREGRHTMRVWLRKPGIL